MGAVPVCHQQTGMVDSQAENAPYEMKNPRGWGGFVTKDRKRTRIMAPLNVAVSDGWAQFVPRFEPEAKPAAPTSQPHGMEGLARVLQQGRQNGLALTVEHCGVTRLW